MQKIDDSKKDHMMDNGMMHTDVMQESDHNMMEDHNGHIEENDDEDEEEEEDFPEIKLEELMDDLKINDDDDDDVGEFE